MAFPSLLFLGQNASIFISASITYFIISKSRISLLGITKPLQWLALFFALGAILSVVNIPDSAATESLDRAMAVLPNYLYWSLLIIILIQQSSLIKLDVVYKAVFWGVVCTVVYYLLLQQTLTILPIFNRQTPNGFAFVLICYAPIAVYYLKEQKNKTWALVFLMLLVLILLRDGRRAGMVLVLLGGLAVVYGAQVNWKRLLAGTIVATIVTFILYSSPAKAVILQSNERIYEMLYETDKIRTEDRSYLVRVAMIKKSIALFNQNKFTGIGLNNFTKTEIEFDKNFIGAKYVVSKKNIQSTSSHNSYINILAEGGLFLFIPFVLILSYCVIYFIGNLNKLHATYKPFFFSLIAMSIHLYFITAIINVYAWFLIGICAALTSIRKK